MFTIDHQIARYSAYFFYLCAFPVYSSKIEINTVYEFLGNNLTICLRTLTEFASKLATKHSVLKTKVQCFLSKYGLAKKNMHGSVLTHLIYVLKTVGWSPEEPQL